MKLPPNLKQQYLSRLDVLIRRGEEVPVRSTQILASANLMTGEKKYRPSSDVDWPKFVEWRTACVTLLDQVVPRGSAHRPTVEGFTGLGNSPEKLQFGVAFLRAIREDVAADHLNDLASEIEAEISADYMGQAEQLLLEGASGRYDHVPAAVLAGAVLEKSLRTLCTQLSPPEPTRSTDGKPLRLNALIDTLKKRGAYNELTAKQLRAWAAIRNDAAHGNFGEFNRAQVEAMVTGVGVFLAQNL
jgi:hypothetical protein